MKQKRSLVVTLVAMAALASTLSGQDNRAAAREVVGRWQEAVVSVRVVLKMRMSMGGREMQASDDPVNAVGTVIDPSGLTVLSLRALNPGGLMTRIMGSAGGGTNGEPSVDITTEPSDVKIRLADGRELPARIVLRDEDLDLVFLRPTKKPEKPLVAIDLTASAKPALLEQVLVLTRLGRVGGWAAGGSLRDVSAVIERPRTFYVLSGADASVGTPAFSMSGRVIGLLTLRHVDAGRASMSSMLGGSEGFGVLAVILPAEDVLEIAKQAPDR
jgi:S1-C subfamily serine protease